MVGAVRRVEVQARLSHSVTAPSRFGYGADPATSLRAGIRRSRSGEWTSPTMRLWQLGSAAVATGVEHRKSVRWGGRGVTLPLPGTTERNSSMASPDRAHSRTFVVTGAASGIGLATARRLLDEGGTVVGADLASPPDLGPGFTFVTADITDEAAVAAILAAVPDRPDGAVHAAGVAGRGPGPLPG